ncbi:Serine--tRNA ligase, cytoplasmic [Capsicum baccatum]|uniref:serine--tRNA ligase n=1 Tax=Capsicum baccatum TaxID=33114 RepID=A0A2G2VXP0_CAPBA|nr:Serine--tRNA ligase, cytoplasmic [Capsicum baccatum]
MSKFLEMEIKGADVARGRGYYVKEAGVRLNQALINFALDFLEERGYTPLKTPFFVRNDIMAKYAQLAQFVEELCLVSLVTGDGDEKYLISTVEHSLCADQSKDHIPPSQLPLKYAGYLACFHIEAGSHGHDTLGIFRVHQFAKVVLFCLTSLDRNDSYYMHEEMIKTLEQFF